MAYTTIDNPGEYFSTKLYTGNGSTQSITGVGFQPDWVWQKTRNYDYSHSLVDVVRGASLNMFSNNTLGDQTVSNGLTSFDSDGFSVGADLGWNASASDRNSKVAWNWKAGGSASSNSNGSITSSVSASTDAGFSIVTYTGTGSSATVGHGLGVAPKIYIIKNRTDANDWKFYTTAVDGSLDILNLNTTDAKADSGGSLPTSSIFYIGTNANQGESGKNYIAYCFAEKKGYSKFGSYTGNALADGTFVYTGFKPAFVIVKRSSDTQSWVLWDNKRDGYNQTNPSLTPNESGVEETRSVDFLSNGFKQRQNNTATNAASTYIYMAFAEHPFTSSTGTPVTAR